MALSSRFALATQVLTALAARPEGAQRSEDLAAWARTNAVVIRRLLGALGRAGLTASRLGQGGGAALARPAGEITLADVYRAVEDPPLFAMPRCAPDAACALGAELGPRVGDVVRAAAARAEAAMEVELARVTIADLARALRADPACGEAGSDAKHTATVKLRGRRAPTP